MAEQTVPNEKDIIDEILPRKGAREKLIPAEKMHLFKAKIGEEIARAGKLTQEFVDELLRQLKNGDL